MLPPILVCSEEPFVALVAALPQRWVEARARDDLRCWRALAVWLFDCSTLFSKADLPGVAEDHDTLAMVALQHAHDLQPVRTEEPFAQPATSTTLSEQSSHARVRFQ